MKNITRSLLVSANILVGTAWVAAADPVTFQINMSVQNALGNFNPDNGDTMLVAGTWDNWATTNVLAVTADTNIYSLTLQLASGSYPNYKFVINPGGNSTGSALKWEVPASFSGGNRWFQVPAGGTNLPVVYYSDNTNMPTYQVLITFQVNMGAAVSQGIFTIGADYVSAFGSFDNWGTTGVLLTNLPGTSNYVGTLVSSALNTNDMLVNYKYAIDGNGGTWEGNVGPNGAQNRAFNVTNATQVLPLDYWNNITNVNQSFDVMFEVNMTAINAFGTFTPGVDYLYVNGDWNWSGTALQLTQTGGDPNIYTGSVALAYSPGTVINYKYAINGGFSASDWEVNGVGPGGAQNHQFTLNISTNLPMDYFNNQASLGPITISQSGSETVLYWSAGTNVNNRIRLQSSTNLMSSWADVANTQGQSSITNDFGAGPMYFRITGP